MIENTLIFLVRFQGHIRIIGFELLPFSGLNSGMASNDFIKKKKKKKRNPVHLYAHSIYLG